jgi:hypothetical protein
MKLSFRSVGLAWTYGAFEAACFEGLMSFATEDFVPDVLWHSAWPMMAARAGMLSLISFQVGKIGAGLSNELINGFCSALPISLWLVVVFFHDRWPTSEWYLLISAVMPFIGMLGGIARRKQNWEHFDLPAAARQQEK